MRSSSRFGVAVALTAVMLSLASQPAQAAELASADFVIIRHGTVVDDDLYAVAITVRIDGEVKGDVIAFAADRVVIDGRVTGSVTAIAGSVEVNGVVEGSLRAAANRVAVEGTVMGDVIVTGWDVALSPRSEVGGEVVSWGNRLAALGTIEQDLTGNLRGISLGGRVGGRVVVSVGQLAVVGPLQVGGSLSYRSAREAEGLEHAEVGGTVTRRIPLPPNIRIRALGIFLRGMIALFLTIAAVATVWSWPGRTRAAAGHVHPRAWRQWLAGAAVFATPLALVGATAVMVAVAPPAAGLPLLVVLVPLILAVVALLLVGALVAGVPVALALGRRVFKGVGPHGATLGGAVILATLWMLPWVGWLIPVVALPLGLGAWMTRTVPRHTTHVS